MAFKVNFGVPMTASTFLTFKAKYKNSTGYYWIETVVEDQSTCDGDGCSHEFDQQPGVFLGTNDLSNPSATLAFMARVNRYCILK